jgi:hypothetical protein
VPYDWRAGVFNPGIIFGAEEDGGLMALNFGTGLAPGGILEGFSVYFNWIPSETTPNESQFFVTIRSSENGRFEFGDSGYALASDISAIPEPQTFVLLGAGLVGLAAYCRRNRSRNAKR